MLLVVDVGNTNTVIGLLDGPRVIHQWRLTTRARTTDEFRLALLQLLGLDGVHEADVRGVAIGCVVPSMLFTIEKACRRLFGVTPRVVDLKSVPMPLAVDNPLEVGPDRVINAVAARERFSPPFLVVDFGTATTFDVVNPEGAYAGGAIAPGLQISAEALAARTARLPRVEVQRPTRATGTNTVAAMQSGIYWGYVGLVDGLCRRIKAEVGGTVPCIATGGLANLVGRSCAEIDHVDGDLTLQGLRICWERAS
jgi:type III pantothenate kinase